MEQPKTESQTELSWRDPGFEERGTEAQLAGLYAALAAASANFGPIVRDRHVKIRLKSGGEYEYDYAPLKNLIDATRPALAAQGLFIAQPMTRVDPHNGMAMVRTIVSHKDGARLIYSFEFVAAGDIKDFGGQTTYARRYQYQTAVGVDAGEVDEDEVPRSREQGAQAEQRTKQRQAPVPEPRQTNGGQDAQARGTKQEAQARQALPAKQPEPPPEAPKSSPPGPTGEALAQGLGMQLETKVEPQVEREPEPANTYSHLSNDQMRDLMRGHAMALKMGKQEIGPMYKQVTGVPTTDATRATNEVMLAWLENERRERGV